MTKTELEEAVFQALGEASMCWSETPSGVFEDVRAMEIGNQLIETLGRDEANEQLYQSYSQFQTKEFIHKIAHLESEIRLLDNEIAELEKYIRDN